MFVGVFLIFAKDFPLIFSESGRVERNTEVRETQGLVACHTHPDRAWESNLPPRDVPWTRNRTRNPPVSRSTL